MLSNSLFQGQIEFNPGFAPRPGISHVLFDFDGTLSLIREGWTEVMVAMFLEMLPRRPDQTDAEIRRQLTDRRFRRTRRVARVFDYQSRPRPRPKPVSLPGPVRSIPVPQGHGEIQ